MCCRNCCFGHRTDRDLSPRIQGSVDQAHASLARGLKFPNIEHLNRVASYKGTGEISPKGSISWSDFDAYEEGNRGIETAGLNQR
jgi:hypothetical protein